MFPKYLRWWFLAGAVLSLFVMVLFGLRVYSGTAPSSELIKPIVMVVLFAWMFTQAKETK